LAAELATAQFALPRKARDVIAIKTMVGGKFAGSDMPHTVYEYFVCDL
jgi:hypothetical protein